MLGTAAFLFLNPGRKENAARQNHSPEKVLVQTASKPVVTRPENLPGKPGDVTEAIITNSQQGPITQVKTFSYLKNLNLQKNKESISWSSSVDNNPNKKHNSPVTAPELNNRSLSPGEKNKLNDKTNNSVTAPSGGVKTVEPIVKTENIDSKPSPVSPKKGTEKKHDLFFALAGGPDLSFVELGSAGRVKLFGGAAIGYTYNNRLTIRAGFFTGRKIYTAEAYDYRPPAVFYTYYPYLEKVEADCEIYEIPVSLAYNFSKSSTNRFFASAGVSSYFMKEEKYKYYYKTSPGGPTLNREREFKNVNHHHLAGLNLSAGYTRQLTPKFSLTLEPYVKLPLKGIGFGNVKLNSGGLMLSAGIHPFSKKSSTKK